MDADAVVAVAVAVLALLGTAYTQLTSARATRVTAEVAASVELTKVDRSEHDRFVTALQADLARRADDVAAIRARLVGEERRNGDLREQLQSALDETADIQTELRAIRAQLRDAAAELVDERRLTGDLRDRLGELDVQVERLHRSLRQAGLDDDNGRDRT